jgi:DNA-binding MarR family transcriptional regulator
MASSKTTPLPGMRTNVAFHLWHAALRWRAQVSESLAPIGLTHTQFFLLSAIHALGHEGTVATQRLAAERAGLDPVSTSQLMKSLQRSGLVERTDHPSDTRAWQLRLTRAGERQVLQGIRIIKEVNEGFFAPVKGELTQLGVALEKLSGEGHS